MDARNLFLAVSIAVAVLGASTPIAAPVPAARLPVPLTDFPQVEAVSQRELACLAMNIYWESRGEPEEGQRAVAHVTLNRVGAGGFPGTVCGVVRQGAGAGQCQFQWVCDSRDHRPTEAQAWVGARLIAYRALIGVDEDPTGGALYFHRADLRPTWARARQGTTVIGHHVFFRLDGGELGERQLAEAS